MKLLYQVLIASMIFLLGLIVGVRFNSALPIVQKHPFEIDYVNYRGRSDIDLGFEECLRANGLNFNITYWDAERDPDKLNEIRRAIEHKKSDLVVTFGTTTTIGIFGTTDSPRLETVPGIFTLVTSPVLSNIVPNLVSSRRNITGTIHVAPLRDQINLMLAFRPTKKVGVLYTPTELNSVIIVQELEKLALSSGFTLIAIPFDKDAQGKPVSTNAEAAIKEFKRQEAGWLYLPPDSYLGTQTQQLVIPAANAAGIPTFASTEQLMLSGATFGLLSTYFELGVITAQKAIRILQDGADPRNMPIHAPPRFLRKVNAYQAKRLGFGALVESIYQIDPTQTPPPGN